MKCEVCVDSLEGALAAQRGGADRLEVCGHLQLEGVTPTAGLLRAVRSVVSLPVMAMIRPRAGGFLYSPGELGIMIDDIACLIDHGADGVVLGCLNSSGGICSASMRQLIAAAQGRSVTFHRAMDHVADPVTALEVLVDLGVERVLTSGGAADVVAGLPRLRQLVAQAAGRITVMPGGGIRPNNIRRVLRESGASEVHFSARVQAPDGCRTTSRDMVCDIRRQAVRREADP